MRAPAPWARRLNSAASVRCPMTRSRRGAEPAEGKQADASAIDRRQAGDEVATSQIPRRQPGSSRRSLRPARARYRQASPVRQAAQTAQERARASKRRASPISSASGGNIGRM